MSGLTDMVLMPGADYQAICNAVRERTGDTSLLKSGEMPPKIRNPLTKNGSQIVRFAVCSDLHISGTGADAHLTSLLNRMESDGAIDFIAVVGDIVNYDETLEADATAYKTIIANSDIPIYAVAGNHECVSGPGNTLDVDWWLSLSGEEPHYFKEVNGEAFIFLSQESWSGNILSTDAKSFVEEKLEENRTKKRIFLFFHQYFVDGSGFAYRGGDENNSYLNEADTAWFEGIIKRYPNIVWFSGHSHAGFKHQAENPNHTIYNKSGEYCTMVNVPNLATGQYFIVDVYDNLVIITGYSGDTPFDEIFYSIGPVHLPGGGDGDDEGSGGDEADKTLTGISVDYSGGDVAVGTEVTALTGVVVTAHYSDGTSETVTGYTLSGTIHEGDNTITVTYEGASATFTVTGVVESGGDAVKTVIYHKDTITGVLSTDKRSFPIESRNNVVFDTPMEYGKTYYIRADSFTDADGNSIVPAKETVYTQIQEGYVSEDLSKTSSGVMVPDYSDITKDGIGAKITYNNPDYPFVYGFKTFVVKVSGSSTMELPKTITVTNLEIYTMD